MGGLRSSVRQGASQIVEYAKISFFRLSENHVVSFFFVFIYVNFLVQFIRTIEPFFNTNVSNLSNVGECVFFFHHELYEYWPRGLLTPAFVWFE